jgi:hypothetical protein
MINENLILSKLDLIKAEVDFITEHLVDVSLTNDDILSLKEAEKDLIEGKTKRL